MGVASTASPTAGAMPATDDPTLEELEGRLDARRARLLEGDRIRQEILDAGGSQAAAEAAFLRAIQTDAELVTAEAERVLTMLNVSPEGFLSVLRAQVDREDEKILDARNRIEAALAESRSLSQRMDALQKIHQVLSQEGDQKMRMEEGQIDIGGETLSIGEVVERYGLVEDLNLSARFDEEDRNWFVGIKLRAATVQGAIDTLRQQQQQAASGNEILMITMSQAVTQRGQHLQLVSKMLGILSDTERAIVGNMR